MVLDLAERPVLRFLKVFLIARGELTFERKSPYQEAYGALKEVKVAFKKQSKRLAASCSTG